MGLGPCWIPSGPALFLRVLVLIFEIYRIRVGSESKKYLTGPGSGFKVQTRPRDPDPRPAPQTSVFTYAFTQVFGF